MKTEKLKHIHIRNTVNREAAEWLVRQLKGNTDFKEMIEDILNQLEPLYTYKVQCSKCGKKTTFYNREKITNKESESKFGKNALCESCYKSEVFK